jgi:hypothetical protein
MYSVDKSIVLVDSAVNGIRRYMHPVLQSFVIPVRAMFGSKNCLDLIVSAIKVRHPGDVQ